MTSVIESMNEGAAEADRQRKEGPAKRKHSHYFKECPFDEVDVYRVLVLFSVTDPCIAHAIKKLLVAGGRGGGKDIRRDIREAVDTLERWENMRVEEQEAGLGDPLGLPPRT